MRRLQELKSKYILQKTVTSYVQQNNQDLQRDISDLNETIEYMQKRVDKNSLQNIFSSFMHNITLMKIDEQQKQKLKSVTYYLEARVDSMQNFYDLLKTLMQNKYPVRIEYPLTFKRAGDKIAITLFLTLYQLKTD